MIGRAKASLKPPKPEDYLVVNDNDEKRMPFGNHMFCEFKSYVYDACAGPAIGDSARKGYIEKNVDSVTKLNSLYKGFPGEHSRIATYNKCMFQGYYLVDATVKKVV